MVRISTPSIWPSTAMGMASAREVSTEASVRIAKAEQMMAAIFISGGAAAPMLTMPRLISSMDAPTVRPTGRLPSSRPTMVQVMRGRSKFRRPRIRLSRMQNTPTRPRMRDVTNMDRFLLWIQPCGLTGSASLFCGWGSAACKSSPRGRASLLFLRLQRRS